MEEQVPPQVSNMPRYRCHKEVRAFEMGKIEGNRIFPIDGEIPFTMEPDFMTRHNLNQPGYIVFYEDGYRSFSPKDVFEKGYTKI